MPAHAAVTAAHGPLARQQRALHGAEHLLAAEQRFRDVVEGAGFDRLHRRVLAALRGQQDHGRIVRIGRDRTQCAQRRIVGRAVGGEVAADEQHVEALQPRTLAEHVFECAARRLDGAALEAFDDETQQRRPDFRVGLDDQDARLVVGGLFHSRAP